MRAQAQGSVAVDDEVLSVGLRSLATRDEIHPRDYVPGDGLQELRLRPVRRQGDGRVQGVEPKDV